MNDLKALSDYALSFNEDEDHLSISHEVEPSKGILNDLNSSLVINLPTLCSAKTCEDSAMFLKLVTIKRKKFATIVEVSKRVTRGNGTLDNAHVTHVILIAHVALTRKVIRGEGGSPKVVTCLAKKKGQKGASKEVLKLLANSLAKSTNSHHKCIKK